MIATELPVQVVEHYCKAGCGAVVWSYLSTSPYPPRAAETILCPRCGADNSIAPSLGERWRNARRQWRKYRRVYGFFWWTRHAPWRGFLLEREAMK